MFILINSVFSREPFSGFCLFNNVEFKCSKNSEKVEVNCEVVEFDHVYETNHDTDLKLKLLIIFPCISQDSFKDMADKFEYWML